MGRLFQFNFSPGSSHENIDINKNYEVQLKVGKHEFAGEKIGLNLKNKDERLDSTTNKNRTEVPLIKFAHKSKHSGVTNEDVTTNGVENLECKRPEGKTGFNLSWSGEEVKTWRSAMEEADEFNPYRIQDATSYKLGDGEEAERKAQQQQVILQRQSEWSREHVRSAVTDVSVEVLEEIEETVEEAGANSGSGSGNSGSSSGSADAEAAAAEAKEKKKKTRGLKAYIVKQITGVTDGIKETVMDTINGFRKMIPTWLGGTAGLEPENGSAGNEPEAAAAPTVTTRIVDAPSSFQHFRFISEMSKYEGGSFQEAKAIQKADGREKDFTWCDYTNPVSLAYKERPLKTVRLQRICVDRQEKNDQQLALQNGEGTSNSSSTSPAGETVNEWKEDWTTCGSPEIPWRFQEMEPQQLADFHRMMAACEIPAMIPHPTQEGRMLPFNHVKSLELRGIGQSTAGSAELWLALRSPFKLMRIDFTLVKKVDPEKYLVPDDFFPTFENREEKYRTGDWENASEWSYNREIASLLKKKRAHMEERKVHDEEVFQGVLGHLERNAIPVQQALERCFTQKCHHHWEEAYLDALRKANPGHLKRYEDAAQMENKREGRQIQREVDEELRTLVPVITEDDVLVKEYGKKITSDYTGWKIRMEINLKPGKQIDDSPEALQQISEKDYSHICESVQVAMNDFVTPTMSQSTSGNGTIKNNPSEMQNNLLNDQFKLCGVHQFFSLSDAEMKRREEEKKANAASGGSSSSSSDDSLAEPDEPCDKNGWNVDPRWSYNTAEFLQVSLGKEVEAELEAEAKRAAGIVANTSSSSSSPQKKKSKSGFERTEYITKSKQEVVFLTHIKMRERVPKSAGVLPEKPGTVSVDLTFSQSECLQMAEPHDKVEIWMRGPCKRGMEASFKFAEAELVVDSESHKQDEAYVKVKLFSDVFCGRKRLLVQRNPEHEHLSVLSASFQQKQRFLHFVDDSTGWIGRAKRRIESSMKHGPEKYRHFWEPVVKFFHFCVTWVKDTIKKYFAVLAFAASAVILAFSSKHLYEDLTAESDILANYEFWSWNFVIQAVLVVAAVGGVGFYLPKACSVIMKQMRGARGYEKVNMKGDLEMGEGAEGLFAKKPGHGSSGRDSVSYEVIDAPNNANLSENGQPLLLNAPSPLIENGIGNINNKGPGSGGRHDPLGSPHEPEREHPNFEDRMEDQNCTADLKRLSCVSTLKPHKDDIYPGVKTLDDMKMIEKEILEEKIRQEKLKQEQKLVRDYLSNQRVCRIELSDSLELHKGLSPDGYMYRLSKVYDKFPEAKVGRKRFDVSVLGDFSYTLVGDIQNKHVPMLHWFCPNYEMEIPQANLCNPRADQYSHIYGQLKKGQIWGFLISRLVVMGSVVMVIWAGEAQNKMNAMKDSIHDHVNAATDSVKNSVKGAVDSAKGSVEGAVKGAVDGAKAAAAVGAATHAETGAAAEAAKAASLSGKGEYCQWKRFAWSDATQGPSPACSCLPHDPGEIFSWNRKSSQRPKLWSCAVTRPWGTTWKVRTGAQPCRVCVPFHRILSYFTAFYRIL
jgi:hypothetical protein